MGIFSYGFIQVTWGVLLLSKYNPKRERETLENKLLLTSIKNYRDPMQALHGDYQSVYFLFMIEIIELPANFETVAHARLGERWSGYRAAGTQPNRELLGADPVRQCHVATATIRAGSDFWRNATH